MLVKGEWVKVCRDSPGSDVFVGEVYEAEGSFGIRGTSYTKLAGVEPPVFTSALQHAHEGHVYVAEQEYSRWWNRRHGENA
jgi:hypothetical protein